MSTGLIRDISTYSLSGFRSDLLAGLTVAVMLVPQGMAYALLAGLPPVFGLYAALVPLLVYPFFGSSPYLSVGPVALVSIIILSGLSTLATPMSQEYIELALITSMVAGAIQLILAFFRMGFMVNFLSHPVINGFTSAAAFIIALSQLKYLLGIDLPRSSNIIEGLTGLISNIDQLNVHAMIVGIIGILLILGLKRIKKALPGALIAAVLGILFMLFSGWETYGVGVVGEVPAGLPHFTFPNITWAKIQLVLPLALVICLISFIESLAIAKTLAAKHDRFDINADRELVGLGLAKIVGALFQGFPNTGSFTRSAINEQSGAKTGVSSIMAAILIGLTLVFFTSTFYHLPHTILAAIVISAVFGLIDYKEAIHLYNVDKRDFSVLVLTFLLTIFLGIQEGVFAGVILSLILIIQKVAKPHYAILGEVPEKGIYRNVLRYETADEHQNILVFRYDDDLFFGNAEHFYSAVLGALSSRPETQNLILDLSSVSNMDSTGIMYLKRLQDLVVIKKVRLFITGPKGPLRDTLRKNKMYQYIGQNFIEEKIDLAITKINSIKDKSGNN